MSVNWNYFNKFDEVSERYLPKYGQGETVATQIVTAVNKLVYKWYNDGDVFDNVNSKMQGWCNDLSSYANWLYMVVGDEKECRKTLVKIRQCITGDDYEELLKELADNLLDIGFLEEMDKKVKTGDIYECEGVFEFKEYYDDDDEEEYWEE